jgi:hypothetical protein
MHGEEAMDANAQTVPAPRILVAQLDGETVLLDPVSGRYFSLNVTGSRIWRGLCDGSSLQDITEAMANQYQLPVEQVGRDLASFVAELNAEGLLVAGTP